MKLKALYSLLFLAFSTMTFAQEYPSEAQDNLSFDVEMIFDSLKTIEGYETILDYDKLTSEEYFTLFPTTSFLLENMLGDDVRMANEPSWYMQRLKESEKLHVTESSEYCNVSWLTKVLILGSDLTFDETDEIINYFQDLVVESIIACQTKSSAIINDFSEERVNSLNNFIFGDPEEYALETMKLNSQNPDVRKFLDKTCCSKH